MRLCVIPARGGSKRIPRKNIKVFSGRPMVAWSISAALQSECFDRVIVSTDDVEIAEVARANGAEVPFNRPASLADDYTPTAAVVRHAVEWLAQEGLRPAAVCCIYATAPFISAEDLRSGLALLEQGNSDYVLPVTSFAFPIQRALRIDRDQQLRMMSPQFFSVRSQDLEEAFHDAGQFLWGTTEAWTEEKLPFDARTLPLILPRHKVQDIDTPEDWVRAELLFKAMSPVP